MGAPVGNQYYLIRTRNGRPKKYSPPALKNKANEYFEWVLANPLQEAKWSDKHGKLIDIPKMRPFTLMGFCNFADINLDTFKNYEKDHLRDNLDEKETKTANDFLAVTKKIREIVENHQFEGAASGFLNHNIIAAKLGIASKIQHEGNPDKPVLMGKVKMIVKERS